MALFLLVVSSPYLTSLGWGSVGTGPWAAVAYAVVFATAFAGWQRGLSRIGANSALVYQYLITATRVTSGIVFFGETLGVDKIVGGAVILLGVNEEGHPGPQRRQICRTGAGRISTGVG
jgi:drug/metabolite transporter (DMT)-like permease